jgi:hypothetical protein
VPFWRRRKEGVAGAAATEHPGLAAIDASTPHTYRFWLADPGDRSSAIETMSQRERIPLTFELVDEPDGRVRIEVAAAGNGRGQSIMSVFYALQRAGVGVDGYEATDVVDDLSESDLEALVASRQRTPEPGDLDAQVSRLAGMRLLDACLTHHLPVPIDGRPFGWAVMSIALNTPGCEDRLVRVAAAVAARPRAKDDIGYEGGSLLGAAQHRGDLCARTGMPFDVPEDVLLTLVDDRWVIGRKAVELLGLSTRPLSAGTVTKLCQLSRLDADQHAEEALWALRSAPPTPEVRAAVEAAMSSTSSEMRWRGLWLLAHHWGTGARPAWRVALESRSFAVRDVAEQLLARHGDAEDVDDAALRLAKIIRAKPGMSYSPPRGSELIDFLARHRDVPRAQVAFADLVARWDRFPDPDLGTWIRRHHPWIPEGVDGDPAAELDVEPDEPEVTDPPTIERGDGSIILSFSESSAHAPARDLLDDLLEVEPGFEVLAEDREWLEIRVDDADPVGRVRALWERAVAEAGEAEV